MVKSNSKLAVFLAIGAIVGGLSCTWTKKDDDEFYGSLMIGAIIGGLFAGGMSVAASLPLCCGIAKPQAKIIAGLAIGIGIFCCFIPFIASLPASGSAVDKFCERCAADGRGECSDKDREDAKAVVSAFGVIIAYTAAFGFVAVILGIVAAALGCCICCKCCKMKDEEGAAGGAPAVIGQPA